MPYTKPRKTAFDKLGYGALTLYAVGVAALALGVYGSNVLDFVTWRGESDRIRAQVQTGRMLITSEDRTTCRSLRFDNRTSHISGDTTIDCSGRPAEDPSAGGSFSSFRDGFVHR